MQSGMSALCQKRTLEWKFGTLREQLLERPAERRALLPLPVRPVDQMNAHLSRSAFNRMNVAAVLAPENAYE